jgi:hypothetical protein
MEYRGVVYREGLLLFIVDTPRSDESLAWMVSYNRLKRQFSQLEIYLSVLELLGSDCLFAVADPL